MSSHDPHARDMLKDQNVKCPVLQTTLTVPRVYLTVPVTRAASRPQTAYPGSILSGSILRMPKS